MPHLLLTTILASISAAPAAKAKSGSSSSILFIPLILLAGVYFFFLRPRQQKARAARAGAGKTLSVGDEVVTIGGILGTVSYVDSEAVTVEVAPGTHLSFLRRAVNLRAAIAGTPSGTPVSGPVDRNDDATYDDDDAAYHDEVGGEDGWDDQEVAGEEPVEDRPSGSTAVDDTGSGGPGAPDGHGHDPNGKGEGR